MHFINFPFYIFLLLSLVHYCKRISVIMVLIKIIIYLIDEIKILCKINEKKNTLVFLIIIPESFIKDAFIFSFFL